VETKQQSRMDMIKAGLTILLGLGILGLFVVALGGHRFWEDLDRYTTHFGTVKDLSVGNAVKYAGIGVGRVVDIRVDQDDPARIVVEMGVETGTPLYEGTTAEISQKGLVGDNYVLLVPSEPLGDKLAPGAVLPSREVPGMNELTASVAELIETLQPRLERIAQGMESLVGEDSKNQLKGLLADARQTLADMRTQLDMVGTETRMTLQDGRRTMAAMEQSVNATVAGFQQFLDGAGGQWAGTMQEAQLTLSEARGQMDAITAEIGSLSSQLQEDLSFDQEQVELLLMEMQDLVNELQRFSRSMRERPWQILHRPQEVPER
jgi:phospholipid/cholesterol/gamma-HCH transport system substrate-binding protein